MAKAGSPSKKGGGGKKPGGSASPSKPAARPASKPTAKPASKPEVKPPAKPTARPTAKPAASPAAKPSAKPPSKPLGKPAARPASAPAAGKPAGKAPAKGKGAPARPNLPPIPAAKAAPTVEAPPKFRREYRRWLERLISLRHRLLSEGEQLEEEGLKALEQEVSVDHMADYGSDTSEQDTTLALIESKTEALRDVDDAIGRIERKTFGLCEECEQMIPVGRLEVLPHTRYCVKCKEKRERTAG